MWNLGINMENYKLWPMDIPQPATQGCVSLLPKVFLAFMPHLCDGRTGVTSGADHRPLPNAQCNASAA